MKKVILIMLCAVTFVSCNNKTKTKNLIAVNQDNSQLDASVKRGEAVYSDMCITCHLANGKGVPRAFPPLADSDYLRTNQTESIKAVKYGMSGEIVVNGATYNGVMSPLGLSDEEVADVMNYINNTWGNKIKGHITPEKVSKL